MARATYRGTPPTSIDGAHLAASSRQRATADRRLPSALIGLLAVVLLTTGLSWAFLGLALRSLESVFRDRVEALALLHTVNDELQHVVTDMALKAERGQVPYDSAARSVASASVVADSAWRQYLSTWFTPEEATMVARVSPAVQGALAHADRLPEALRAGSRETLSAYLDGAFLSDMDAASAALRELVALQVDVTRSAYEVSYARFEVAKQAFAGAVVAACILVVVALVSSRRRIPGATRRWSR